MPSSEWQRLGQIFEQALEQPRETRDDFLARACGSDHVARGELASLLLAVEKSGEFLSVPALELFARQVSAEGWRVQPGERIGCYTIERRMGAGGMGEVWRARDERLGRHVAIKLLLPHASNDAERMSALAREARAVGTLNHPSVLTVYDVGEHCGDPYLVTECLEGESLRTRLRDGALPLGTALDVALHLARGLHAAHEHGIVHRDLKPENVFLTLDGRVKILDFGLAKQRGFPALGKQEGEGPAESRLSFAFGTVGYMAPEQERGEAVDGRADLFALGVVLYEMLVGCRPHALPSGLPLAAAASPREPAEPSRVHPQLSPALSQLLRRCLAKSVADRYGTAAQVVAALESVIRKGSAPPRPRLLEWLARPFVLLAAALVIGGLAALGLHWRATAQLRWARTIAAPEVQRLLNQGQVGEAFFLARAALSAAPQDPLLIRLWDDASTPAVVATEPAGAEILLAPYADSGSAWVSLGRTPLRDARVPRGAFRVKVAKPGFQPIEGSGSAGAPVRYRLDPVAEVPEGMVRVVGGPASARFGVVAQLDDFWIDRFEVSNRQFKEFVAKGGYSRQEFWREPFLEGERAVSWDQVMPRFIDASGRPGPATWKLGTYPAGQADFPVSGVSWYEAAAYAAYAGKSLPTLYHWYQAAAPGRFPDVLTASNFSGKGPARVGSHRGLGPFGTYDMAGNVKEWSFNEVDQRRFVLGGAWDEPMRMFANCDAKGPFERAPGYGFRLAKYSRPPAPAVVEPIQIDRLGRDLRAREPVSDAMFEVYRRQYAYDRSALNVQLEESSRSEAWQREVVVFDAAYGGERMRAYLFLPKNAAPPYETVVFFPPGDVFILRSSRELSLAWGEPIVRSGRAFVYPIYKGTYERRTAFGPMGSNEARERRIAWSRDLGRTVDYLETRADIDLSRLAFYAVGAGSVAVSLLALEPRFKLSVLQGAGISIWKEVAPEIDAVNFAPRVLVPTLMLNARYDFNSPVEASQRPLFDLLGTPGEHKKHTVLEMGHGIPVDVGAREVLPWLSRYQGPVAPLSTAPSR